VGRSPDDGVEVSRFNWSRRAWVDGGYYALVREWSDRAGSDELDTVVAIQDEVVAGRDGRVE